MSAFPIDLIFPPQAHQTQPYLALPCIKAWLEDKGYTNVRPHPIFDHGCMCEGLPGHSQAQHTAIRLVFKDIAKSKGSTVATLRCQLVGRPDLA